MSEAPSLRTEEKLTHTWYRIHDWKPQIDAVEVVKWTAHFVTYIDREYSKPTERRAAKDGRWFGTWEEAHAKLLKRSEDEVRRSEEHLQRVRTQLGNVRSLKREH